MKDFIKKMMALLCVSCLALPLISCSDDDDDNNSSKEPQIVEAKANFSRTFIGDYFDIADIVMTVIDFDGNTTDYNINKDYPNGISVDLSKDLRNCSTDDVFEVGYKFSYTLKQDYLEKEEYSFLENSSYDIYFINDKNKCISFIANASDTQTPTVISNSYKPEITMNEKLTRFINSKNTTWNKFITYKVFYNSSLKSWEAERAE